ncbi:MAG TPA: DNA translocase FtsK [Symbiobacteriaceae bacterium]|nr:DNA translocase FtsK [Symbiobacteriaceae bacterium]
MEERRVRTRQSRATPPAGRESDVRQEVAGLLLVAAGAWFVLALAGWGGGALGEILGEGLTTLAGEAGAWLLAGICIWLGFYLVYLRFHRRPFTWGRRAWGLLLVLVAVQVLLQVWRYPDHPTGGDFENALNGFGGGLLGWAITTPLTSFFGRNGRYVVMIAAALVGIVLNTEVTFGGAVAWVKDKLFDGAKGAKGAAEDMYKAMKNRPVRPAVEPAEEPVRRRKAAVTEEYNTLGASQVAKPEPPPVLSGSVAEAAATTAPARPEPIIRRTEPQPHHEEKVTDLAAKAAKSVQAATDKQAKKEEVPPAKLVPDARGQLGLDPDALGTPYQLPSLTMLPKPPKQASQDKQDHLTRAELLERTLKTFGVEARVVEISPGPAVTRYELQPGEGVRVNKFTSLADDLALALAAEDIRIEAPIPGKAAVGIEVPNKVRESVTLREVMETPLFLNSASKLTVAFGKDNAGNPVVGDLGKMPHLLIAGSTGSGKSVCMNTIICSVLFKARPDEVKMLMVDPKMVELSTYNGIPHLMAPVITDPKKAAGFLKGAVKEMENRYELFAAAGARNIQQYNQMCLDDPGEDPEHPRKPLPYIVIFVDELADLMMVAPGDVEDSICRLAQMARACGMHLVIATQSPRVDVITGLIKANIPSRIAFAVSSQVDSRVIMDYAGAERLLGRGDMLYHPAGLSKAHRAQGAYIGEKEVEDLVKFVKAQAKPVYTAEELAVDVSGGKSRGGNSGGAGSGEPAEPSSAADAIFPQAVRIVIEHGQASVSILQRRLRCNYNKAARLIDMMEERGFIGPHQGSKPRDVLISLPQWQEMFKDVEGADADPDLA